MIDWLLMIKYFLYALVAYLLITVLIWLFSNKLIFPVPAISYDQQSFKIIYLQTSDNKKLAAVYLSNPKAKYTLLYSHGNGEDLGMIFPLLKQMQQHGFAVFAYDYRGYGLSKGSPSEKGLYLDINAAYRYMVSTLKIPADKIILYGTSLGSGPTIELAINKPIAGIILQSPYMSIYRVVTWLPLFPGDKFVNLKKVKQLKVPVLVMHGKQDEVIPFFHGWQVHQAIPGMKQALWLRGVGHNDFVIKAGEQYWQAITRFVNCLPNN